MTTYLYWLNNTVLIKLEIKEVDDSFDHAFGTEKKIGYSVESMRVIAHLKLDQDSDEILELDIAETLLRKYPERYRDLENRIFEKFLRDGE